MPFETLRRFYPFFSCMDAMALATAGVVDEKGPDVCVVPPSDGRLIELYAFGNAVDLKKTLVPQQPSDILLAYYAVGLPTMTLRRSRSRGVLCSLAHLSCRTRDDPVLVERPRPHGLATSLEGIADLAFSSLATRLQIPLGNPGYIAPVLAGPMLRKVTPQSATVWVALRSPATVTLSVSTLAGAAMATGQRTTVALGVNLHIVAITAPASTAMVEGVIYQYDLTFDFDNPALGTMTLAAATENALLAYTPYTLPTFCLPPQDPNLLRLICGSCRKPSGDGKDHLALLDSLLSQAAQSSSPLVRPHQLLLMGDQIYADDVAESLLTMLTDAGSALLGWEENIPGGLNNQPFKAADRPSYTRYQMLKDAGFTSEDMRCHLMGFGEYLSMYLFVWSDVLWPATTDQLPSYDEIAANVTATQANFTPGEAKTIAKNLKKSKNSITDTTASLDVFRKSMTAVRRALANIPIYMICDDHEVTDDWNMTRDNFCKGVYGHDIGLRIVQNALCAYSLCQHWGNAPEQFDPATTAGGELLNLLDKGNASTYDRYSAGTSTPSLRSLVSVHTYQDIMKQTPPGCYHDPVSLDFHYTIEGAGHQVVVTDTRTWRTYFNGGSGAPDLLPPAQFTAQITNTPSLRTANNVDRVLLVVLTTNAPPTEFLRAFTRHDWLANHKDRYPDIYESWEMLTPAYDRLLKAISSKLPAGNGKQHYGPAVILSGDVHSSFASRLVYDATTRYEDDPLHPEPTTAVIAQIVASSFRKQTGRTVDIHKKGYNYDPTHIFTPKHVQEGYAGWNVAQNASPAAVASWTLPGMVSLKVDMLVSHDRPSLVFTKEIPESLGGLDLHKAPDYRYRLEYVPQTSKAASTSNLSPVTVPPLDGSTPAARAQAIKTYETAMDHLVTYHGDGAGGGDMVGVNNLCELSFEWGANDEKYVNQKVRWWYTNKTDVKLLEANYRLKLDPKDFPDITPAIQP